MRDTLLTVTGQAKYCVLSAREIMPLAARYCAGALIDALGYVTDAEREIAFNANGKKRTRGAPFECGAKNRFGDAEKTLRASRKFSCIIQR